MDDVARLRADYPWTRTPLVVSAPMRLIALADMAVEVSNAGGIGFIGAGTDVSDLETHLKDARARIARSSLSSHSSSTLPVGVGFINWGASLHNSLPLIQRYKPVAVWFFAPKSLDHLEEWVRWSRKASPQSKIWIQIGSVKEALDVLDLRPDVLVVQGTDAGGHGLVQGASIVSLLPEMCDAIHTRLSSRSGGGEQPAPILLAAGGISESRSAAAALCLGASGVVMGTRFLACHEAKIAKGYQNEVLRASDGGQSTVRTKVYDNLRGTTGWAETHNARGIVNRSFLDAVGGMSEKDNKRLYEKEMQKGDGGWGAQARMTTYAGSGIGLVKSVKGARDIVIEVREGVTAVLRRAKL